ncbi:MAG: hypothetical protein V2I56_24280, partial [Desulfobacteraceae bacterium]|nr:hypothetical protein [Desulfobacteraceae bacterium]
MFRIANPDDRSMKIQSCSKPPRYRRLPIAMWVLVFAGGLLATVGATADEGYEQLIVFLQPGASGVETVFETQRLPEVRELAREMGVDVIVRDAGQKAPADIAVTPLLVYQNHR